LISFLVFIFPLHATSVTGVWGSFHQQDFEARDHDGDYLHFRVQYRDAARTQIITMLDPLTGQDTGKTARQIIAEQAATYGWPLIGIYVSGWGQVVPHFIIHRSGFPKQTGNPEIRAEKLQDDIDAAFERIYKSEKEVTDPTDPDFGQTDASRFFWIVSKFFNYRADQSYAPVTDYTTYIGKHPPRSSWWQ
jgi:hypothetical protein